MKHDVEILQELGRKYAEAAAAAINQERRKLHTALNDLHPIRPIVLLDEIPWHEFDSIEELSNRCQDEYLRSVETYLRRTLYQFNHFGGDMIVPPYIPVEKVIHSSGLGIEIRENTLSTEKENHIVSHEYIDQLRTPEQAAALHAPTITYNESETLRRIHLLSEIFGSIIPVKAKGLEYHIIPWDDLCRYRGVENLLFDLIDRPEFMHTIIDKLTDISLATIRQYEALNLFEPKQLSIHCTSALTSDLPSKTFNPEHVRACDVWGRGAAQIFSNVSSVMHEEFDIDYMKKSMSPFGLNYYGCCEPLHTKIDIVEKIPNLRKISISPWADVAESARLVGPRYVLSVKPSPSNVALGNTDMETIKTELNHIANSCTKFDCAFELVLKDISTVGHNPENLSKWEQYAMSLVCSL